MFEYQVNRRNTKDIQILPTDHYFEEIKVALITDESKDSLQSLFENGFIILNGKYVDIDTSTNLRYLVKPTSEVIEHFGTNKIGAEIRHENVIFSVSMEGSTTGMTHSAVAGAVDLDELDAELENFALPAHNLIEVAYKLYKKEDPNYKYNNTGAQSATATRLARQLFKVVAKVTLDSTMASKVDTGEYDLFYKSADNLKLLQSFNIEL